jgi:hypothetical protein
MSEAGRVWQLFRGDELNAEVRPAARFSEVRPLYDEKLRRLDHLDEEPEQWEAVYRRIREVVRLQSRARIALRDRCSSRSARKYNFQAHVTGWRPR